MPTNQPPPDRPSDPRHEPPSGLPVGGSRGPLPAGPPATPPGPRPSAPPPTWQDASPEVLQGGFSGRRPPGGHGAAPGRGRGPRATLVVGAALIGVGVLAGGAWAGYSMFFATGAQPAEALPDTTIGYVSVDLDPRGTQKLEGLKTLRQFPGFAENVDVAADDDLRRRLFEQIQGDGTCPDIDFADDIDPWLGNRFAAAAIDLGGSDAPSGSDITAVGVIQVDDAAGAETGLAALHACDGESDSFGFSVAGEWAVVAETTEIAEQVSAAASEASLGDDADFQRWTDQAGDPGILTAYASPRAATFLSDTTGGLSGLYGIGGPSLTECLPSDPGADPFATCGDPLAPTPGAAGELSTLFDGFEGAALTVRFADSGLEVETAVGSSLGEGIGAGEAGDDVLSTLPDDTAVAVGFGLPEGWFDAISSSADDILGQGGLDELLSPVESATGLDLPGDVETLLGDSTAVALGGDADLTAFAASEPPTDLPLGVKVEGDGEAIAGLLDTILGAVDDSALDTLLGYDVDGDVVAAGPSPDYRASLLEDGGLGGTDAYRNAVLNSGDAGAVLFVNFDTGSWLSSIPDLPDEVRANLEPLSALGLSTWSQDGVNHLALRVSTDGDDR